MIPFESWQNEAETRAAMGKLRPGGNMQPAELFNLAVFELEEMLGITMFSMIHYFPPLHLLLLQLLCPIIEPIVAHQSKGFHPSALEPCCFLAVNFAIPISSVQFIHIYFILSCPRLFFQLKGTQVPFQILTAIRMPCLKNSGGRRTRRDGERNRDLLYVHISSVLLVLIFSKP